MYRCTAAVEKHVNQSLLHHTSVDAELVDVAVQG